MPPSNTQSSLNYSEALKRVKPNLAFVVIIFGALIAFEIFNYSTTDHALRDLLGDLTFAGIYWSTILAIAFCGIDFAGIARLFTPEQGADEPKEVWYLFGAWLLAATMNAVLTWWGVSMAIAGHSVQSSSVIDPKMITTVVPLFVAIMVWVIRILIIGSLSLAMDRLLHPDAVQARTAFEGALNASSSRATAGMPARPAQAQPSHIPSSLGAAGMPARPSVSRAASAAPTGNTSRFSRGSNSAQVEENDFHSDGPARGPRPEPTYHSLSMSARPPVNGNGSSNGSSNGTGNNHQRRL